MEMVHGKDAFFIFFLRSSPKPDSSTVRRLDDARTLPRRTGTDLHTFCGR